MNPRSPRGLVRPPKITDIGGVADAPPGFTLGSGAGAGATCSISGTDAAGTITLTPGSGQPGNSAIYITVAFNAAYDVKPIVFIEEANYDARNSDTNAGEPAWVFDQGDVTIQGFRIKAGPDAGSVLPTSPCKFNYYVINRRGVPRTFSPTINLAIDLGANQTTWSWADLVAANATYTPGTASGSLTIGGRLQPTLDGTLYGVRVYVPSGFPNPGTDKCSVWDAAGTRLGFGSIAIAGAGLYNCLFSAPVALSAYAYYRIGSWETSGAKYQDVKTWNLIGIPAGGPNYFWIDAYSAAAGDTNPTTGTGSTNAGVVTPILSFP